MLFLYVCMIQSRPTDLVPLTEDEKDSLFFIFKKRRRFLVIVYTGMVIVAIILSMFFYGMDTLRNLFVPKDDTKYASTLLLRAGCLAFVFIILLTSGIYFYVKRVLAFRIDAESGIKERIAYTIIRKTYYPMTNQYYLTFDDPLYPHHETDRDTWYNCYEGGYFFIYRAKKSKFVFEENGRFNVI